LRAELRVNCLAVYRDAKLRFSVRSCERVYNRQQKYNNAHVTISAVCSRTNSECLKVQPRVALVSLGWSQVRRVHEVVCA
jgi:hypothetical protein